MCVASSPLFRPFSLSFRGGFRPLGIPTNCVGAEEAIVRRFVHHQNGFAASHGIKQRLGTFCARRIQLSLRVRVIASLLLVQGVKHVQLDVHIFPFRRAPRRPLSMLLPGRRRASGGAVATLPGRRWKPRRAVGCGRRFF